MIHQTTKQNGLVCRRETALIRLGSPRRKCEYTGICRMEAWSSGSQAEQERKGDWIRTLITFNPPDGLVLMFRLQDIPEATMKRHFSRGIFEIIHPFEIPVAFARHWGLTAGQVIAPGKYPVMTTDHHLCLCLCLQKKEQIFNKHQNPRS